MIRLQQPLLFWLLLIPLVTSAVAMALAARRSGRQPTRAGRRTRAWWPLRLATASLVALAVGRPVWYQPRPYEARIFLADVSDSIPPHLQQAEADWISRQLRATDERHPAGLIVFGQTALVERPLGSQAALGGLSAVTGFRSRPGTAATNLAAAVKLAMSSLPPGLPARLVLLSDGKQTEDSVLDLVDPLRARGLPVDVVALPTQTGEEVALIDLRTAARLLRNEDSLRATLIIQRVGPPLNVPLTVAIDEVPVYQGTVSLNTGKSSLTLALPVPPATRQQGQFTLTAHLAPARPHDTQAANNDATRLVAISGPSRYLVVAPTPSQSVAAALLRQDGLTVDVRSPLLMPTELAELANWAAVILEDVPAYLLNDPQLQAIEHYVTRVGGGLLLLGGPNSYGPGGYFGTPLERVLPVYSEAPERIFAPSVALLLLIDQSGSMGDLATATAATSPTAGGLPPSGATPTPLSASVTALNKLDLAKQAAAAAAGVLAPGDLIGVVSFQTSPVWAVPLQRAENQLLIRAQLARLLPGGGTAIAPALEQAAQTLPGIQAMVKHVLLLTDGRGETNDYSALIQQIRRAGATLTTVAVGHDADQPLLAKMAQQGGGRFYAAADPRQVPQIFVTETRSVTRDLRRNEEFTPRLSSLGPPPFWPRGAALPPLHGYVITTPKPQARVWYTVPASPPHPLLASGRFGLGQSLAFTSGLAGPWGERWRHWPQLAAFLGQAVRSVANLTTNELLRPTLEFRGGQALLTLEAVQADGSPRPFLHPTATVTFPTGQQQEVLLHETEPGLYTGQVPAAAAGGYLATFFIPPEVGNSPPARAQAVALLPYPAEYRGEVENRPLLFELTTLTGGRLLTLSADSWAVGEGHLPTPISLVPFCLLLTALCFLLDLSVRYVPAGSRARLSHWWQTNRRRWRERKRRLAPAGTPATPAGPVGPAPATTTTSVPALDPVERFLQEQLAGLYAERHQTLNPPGPDRSGRMSRAPTDPLQQAWRYLARRRRPGHGPSPRPPTPPG